MTTIAFNTGRLYTEHGQRIAAQRLDSGAILMLDIDRGIDYLLHPATALTRADVMRAYDATHVVYVSDIGMDYADYYAQLRELQAAAELVPSLKALEDERAEECSNPTWGA
jgi:hypothetical protein